MNTTGLRQVVVAVAAGLAAIGAVPASAADASSWSADTRSAMRLIAGARAADSPARELRAGVEIKLGADWKTYWRYPGDAGVPPRFDFARSDNVKSVQVLWPAPHRISDESGNSIGYKGGVIFPLLVTPADPAKPVTLRLKLDYAVCEKICIPAEGSAELELKGGASERDAALADAEARVPKAIKLGEQMKMDEQSFFSIRGVKQDTGADGKPRVVVDVMAPVHFTVDLFAEGPSAEWALPLPEPVPGAPAGSRRFAFALDGLPPGGSAAGAVLKLTATAGTKAIEVTTRLD
jgi:DsbC/DsbD-like thiol-disulfide interchange protein